MRDHRLTTDLDDLRVLSARLGRTAVGTPRRVLAVSIALVVAMGVATGVFARAYHEAEARRGRTQFLEGQAAANGGRAAEAVDHYRAALALDRDQPMYRRALAITLLSLRRTAEAETHLSQLLERDPVDGETNLLLARLAASRGALDDTEAFYQRAIYGRWPGSDANDAAARRVAARFELIAWLVQMGAPAPARGELLRLQAELPDVPFLQRQLARELLELDLPVQAASILTRELTRRPADADVAADLVKAEMASGRFVQARNAARRALALDSQDAATRERLDQISQVLALDPSQHGLSPADRFERSQRLLRRVVADLDACVAPAAPSGPTGTAPSAAGQPASNLPADAAMAIGNARLLLAHEQSLGLAAGAQSATSLAPGQSAAPGSTRAGAAGRAASAEQNRAAASGGATSSSTSSSTVADGLQARADARLGAAEAVWAVRVARCGPSPGALAWIFDRLSTEAPPGTAESVRTTGSAPLR